MCYFLSFSWQKFHLRNSLNEGNFISSFSFSFFFFRFAKRTEVPFAVIFPLRFLLLSCMMSLQRILQEFQEATKLDQKKCRKILQKAKWDLPQAIEIFESSKRVKNVPPNEHSDRSNSSSSSSHLGDDKKARQLEKPNFLTIGDVFPFLRNAFPQKVTFIPFLFVVGFLFWLLFLALAVYVEFSAVFLLFSGITFIFLNTGERKQGQLSAYSVFNPECKPITGAFESKKMDNFAVWG